MKAQIIKVKGFWRLLYYRPDRNHGFVAITEDYLMIEGAWHRWDKLQDRVSREIKAWDKIRLQLSRNLLSVKEYVFISDIEKRACRNITRRQYGYLSGIIERQKQI